MVRGVRLGLVLLLAVAGAAEAAPEAGVPLWGRWEGTFKAPKRTEPTTEVVVELRSPNGITRVVEGFWDGGTTWRARFMPDQPGVWSYHTQSNPPTRGLDKAKGSFTVVEGSVGAGPFAKRGAIRVARTGTHFEHADGTPFFWLGDTAWNGPLLATEKDWQAYLTDRAGKRFSVVQFVLTAPWRTALADEKGDVAFTGRDAIQINAEFFQRMDARVEAINRKGMLAAPVMLWAIRGEENPGYSLPEDQAIRLARYLVARYSAHHVAWLLAGDGAYIGPAVDRWKRIGKAVFGDGPHAPVTLHAQGMQWPFPAFRNELWLNFFGYQSGHGDSPESLKWIHSGPPAQEWKERPARPLLNLEPPYEDHLAYQSQQPHTAYNIRRACYWSLLNAPTAGLTYGAHGIWSWQREAGVPRAHARSGTAKAWSDAAQLPGSAHMGHLAGLFTSLPWWKLRPAPELLVSQPGGEDPARFVGAARADDGQAAVLYLPVGGEVSVRVDALAGGRRAEWFDPRTGGRSPARAEEAGRFKAPDNQDWVLVFSG